MSKLTQEEINALKALAQLAPTIVSTLGQSVALPTKKKRGRPPKSKPDIIPQDSQVKKEENSGQVRVNKSPRLPKQKKGVACRREPINTDINRPNTFDKMAEKNQFKEDSSIDKKLWKNKQLAPRGNRSTLVTIDCTECNGTFEVSPNEIKKDFDGNEEYTCNECLLAKR